MVASSQESPCFGKLQDQEGVAKDQRVSSPFRDYSKRAEARLSSPKATMFPSPFPSPKDSNLKATLEIQAMA